MTSTSKAGNLIGHIERDGYIADILVSTAYPGQIYHYIIQPADSPAVLSWGQERTLEDAQQAIDDYLNLLCRHQLES